MPPKNFTCKQCGRCCDGERGPMPSHATEEDMERWVKHARYDIIDHVDTIELGGVVCSHDIWFDPDTGEEALTCPWLSRRSRHGTRKCTIHDLKPDVCRGFPHSRRQAAEYGCPGFEPAGGGQKPVV